MEVCHKVEPFTIREQKNVHVASPKSKVQQRIYTKKWFSLIVEVQNFFELRIAAVRVIERAFFTQFRWVELLYEASHPTSSFTCY